MPRESADSRSAKQERAADSQQAGPPAQLPDSPNQPEKAEPVGDDPLRSGPSRRAFLTGAGAAAVAGLAAACAADDGAANAQAATQVPEPNATAAVVETPTAIPTVQPTPVASAISFNGSHQRGVLAAPAAAGIVAAFDVTATSRDELAATMQALSTEIARLMEGRPSEQEDQFLPPVDSGAIGADSSTAGTTITLGVGASLFDDRFGLADRRPRELIAMPRFFNDRFVLDEMSHGDMSILITAANQQAAVFALHQIVRVTDRRLRLRWVQEGYNHLLPGRPKALSQSRNLMGFRDGTSNPDTGDDDAMNEHVWIQPGSGEPAWTAGGSYQAVRIIRMLIEFWATAALVRQEQIFGRHRDTGAPLGLGDEADEPVYTASPDDLIPRRAHMRLANPRTPGSPVILRQGFSYLNGASPDGTLDQGLLFNCFQSSLSRGFLDVQSRLDGEPLEDYVKPVGGGLFFVLPGPGDAGGWLGQSLLT